MTEKDLGVDARKLLETLDTKTTGQIASEMGRKFQVNTDDARKFQDKKWVSVENVTAVLVEVEEKNVEYAKLVTGQAKEYAEKMATVQAKELSLRKELETWMIAKGKRLYEIETMLQQMEIEWQGQERNSEDFQELWIRGSDLLKKLFDETFPLEQAKVSVDRKQLSELFETKRKEWKIAYPLKSQEDFNYRVLIDEIFDELVKELLAGFVGVEPENKKKEP